MYGIALEFTCGNKDVVGITEDYYSTRIDLNHTCNDGCLCTTAIYEPICIEDRTYFSPCYAGCKTKLNETEGTYSDCSCASSEVVIGYAGECDFDRKKSNHLYGLDRTNNVRQALKIFLDLIKSDECDKKSYVFIFVMFLVIFFEFLPPTIVPIATLRLVSF